MSLMQNCKLIKKNYCPGSRSV